MFSRSSEEEISVIKSRYPSPRSALLPVLFVAQRDFGWLSPEALVSVSEVLGIPKALVRGVATFHTMFRNKPLGKNVVQLCNNIACTMFGSSEILDFLKDHYGLVPGGTTEDGRLSLITVECIGACDTPPSMLVNGDFHTNLSTEAVVSILDACR